MSNSNLLKSIFMLTGKNVFDNHCYYQEIPRTTLKIGYFLKLPLINFILKNRLHTSEKSISAMHQKRRNIKNVFWHEKQILSKIEAAATSSIFVWYRLFNVAL